LTGQQGIGVYFPIAAKLLEFEEFFTAMSNKSKKEEAKNDTSYKNLFDFFDLVVNFFSQVCRV
jgi:hypothetical protein